MKKVMNSVNVLFEEENHNYMTSVSPYSTKESATKYFVGSWFNTEPFPSEVMRQCIGIEFTDNNKICCYNCQKGNKNKKENENACPISVALAGVPMNYDCFILSIKN
jgi:hypothetical protein